MENKRLESVMLEFPPQQAELHLDALEKIFTKRNSLNVSLAMT